MSDTGDMGDWLMGFQDIKVERHPWMDSCEMVLGTTENVNTIIDECIASGLYALDLETSGLDTRVFDGCTRDHIAGICLSPDGVKGYYIPVMHDPEKYGKHNVPGSVWRPAMRRLIDSPAVAIFHNGKFDHEFLQFNGDEALGEWDSPKKWEDTLIMAYLRNPRARQKGLKALSKAPPDGEADSQVGGPGLGMEMIDLHELWGHTKKKKSFNYDFTTLDPAWGPSLWYAASDAICTYRLHKLMHAGVIATQKPIYVIEKLCVAATRWMERNRIFVDNDKVIELVHQGQQEWIDSVMELYGEASEILKRDVMPGHYKVLRDIFVPDDHLFLIKAQVKQAKAVSQQRYPDPMGKIKQGGKEYPPIYDVNSPQQLGKMFAEMRIPGLKYTEKTGQVVTKAAVLDKIIEDAGERFPFMGKVKRFRQIWKALSSYLYPMLLDVETSDNSMRINFQGHKVDTGRFSTPAKDDARAKVPGWPQVNLQSIPATYDPDRPPSMTRLRECIVARKGNFIIAVDFAGVELRIVTNLCGEPKWLEQFFRCSGCGKTFDRGDGLSTPKPPPCRCPECGSDKIGDLHTLTALKFFGDDAVNKPNWKKLRGDGKCVHPDTLVGQANGLRPLRDLTFGLAGVFQTAQPLATVWSGDSYAPIKETYNGGVKPLYHVITRRGILTCTDEHAFVRADGSQASLSTGLEVGQGLAEPGRPPLGDPYWPRLVYKPFDRVPTVEVQTSADLAYFAGVYSGDGIKGGVSTIGIAHGSTLKTDVMGVSYADWQDILVAAVERVGLRPTRREETIYLGSRHVMRYLAALGLVVYEGARTLRVPSWVLSGGRIGMLQFLGGLFDTDGSVSKRDSSIEWTTKDPVFAGQVAAVLVALGVSPYMEPSWNKTYERWYYRVRVRASQALIVSGCMRHPGKRKRLRKVRPGRMLPNAVIRVLPAGEGPCVDLSLDTPDHLYWANGHLTHNSSNFALCYGGGGSAVSRSTGCDKQEGWRRKRTFDSTYTVLGKWWEGQHRFARQHGFVTSGFGRRYPVPDINSADGGFKAKAERNAVNGPVQSTSADITKLAMALIYKEFKKRGWLEKGRMIITMHDELVFDMAPDIMEEAIDVIQEIMCSNSLIKGKKWAVPYTTDVEIGHNWTVPWDLNSMRALEVKFDGDTKYYKEAKATEAGLDWATMPTFPAILQPHFSRLTLDGAPAPTPPSQEKLAVGASPSEGPPPSSTEPAPTPPAAKMKPIHELAPPSSNGVCSYTLNAPLTLTTVFKLADVIRQCRNRGTKKLRLVSSSGDSLDGWVEEFNHGEIHVSDQEFYILARNANL